MWDKLSMSDRAEYIRLGVYNGITDLNTIREIYNSYANGGSFRKWRKAIDKHKGLDIKNDPTYDYRGFYKNDPDAAWDMLNKDSEEHFTDEFKTALHPTFSNESRYSGKRSRFNRKGVIGGSWIGDNYILSTDQLARDWDTNRTLDYLRENDPSVTLRDPYYGAEIMRSVSPTPNAVALTRSRVAKGPNRNFLHAQDMNLESKLAATLVPRIVKSKTCINTVTGFCDPKNTVASNYKLLANPEKYGYEKINQSDAVPGDLIILSDKNNHPVHAVMFDSIARENGIHNGYPILKGDTLVNYSNGGRSRDSYRLQGPLTRFDDPNNSGGDFSGSRTYLRYTGKNLKRQKRDLGFDNHK